MAATELYAGEVSGSLIATAKGAKSGANIVVIPDAGNQRVMILDCAG